MRKNRRFKYPFSTNHLCCSEQTTHVEFNVLSSSRSQNDSKTTPRHLTTQKDKPTRRLDPGPRKQSENGTRAPAPTQPILRGRSRHIFISRHGSAATSKLHLPPCKPGLRSPRQSVRYDDLGFEAPCAIPLTSSQISVCLYVCVCLVSSL
ncbi:hypothetical protein M758_1G110500 [Ceratodon purpureus]|nr:hypothetical protein M758_1G110500 [Ceratodon purpureus]